MVNRFACFIIAQKIVFYIEKQKILPQSRFLPLSKEETGRKGFFQTEETAVLSGLNRPVEETANPEYRCLQYGIDRPTN